MTDSTSVGTIQLDVEVNQNSLDIEMNRLSKVFSNSFKKMFSGMKSQTNNFVKDSIGRIGNSFKNFSQTGTGSSERISKSISKMNAEYEKTETKIAKIRKELAVLFAEQDTIARNYQNMPSLSGMTKDETMEQLLKSDPKYNKLSEQIDKLISKLDPLVAKNKELAKEIKNVGDGAEDTGKKIDNMGKKSKKAGKNIEKVSLKTKLFGNEMKKSGGKAVGFAAMVNRSFKTILRRIFIYSLILKGIRGIMNYTGAALKTNKQFVNSLNIVKTNLMVAFQPIYDFILPALNALMKAVATVTTYIAAAISALFGKTYKQSFNTAKNLDNTKKAMAGYGKAAKKAGKDVKGALMGFDEINQLDTKDDVDGTDGGSEVGDFEMTMPDLATVDISGIEKFKEIMSQIFEPFKLAWENEGQATIDAMKYAFGEIKGLVKAIGNSWLEVWTNGTGQAILETILRILQNIFGLAGDIAKATRLAWEENNLGTQLIQTIANAILNILGLIEQIGISWREVWNNGTGQQIMSTILKILQNIFKLIGDVANSFTLAWTNAGTGTAIMQAIHDIIQSILDVLEKVGSSLNNVWEEVGNVVAQAFLDILKATLETLVNLGEKLVWVWDHGGQHLFEGFLKLGAKIFELVGYIYTEFVLPFIEWFTNLMAPAVAKLADWIGKLFGVFANLIDWMLGKGKPVLDVIITVLGSMAVAFGIVKGAIKAKMIALSAYQTVISAAFVTGETFRAGLAAIATPAGIATLAITGIIAVGTLLYKHWDEISVGLKKIWEGIENVAKTMWNGLAAFFINIWEGIKGAFKKNQDDIKEHDEKTWDNIKTKTSEIWNAIKTFLIDKIWNPIKNVAQTIWEGIKKVILNPINQAWTKLKEVWDKIKEYILRKWNEIKEGISSMKDKLVSAVLEPFKIVDGKIKGIIDNAKDWGRNLIGSFVDGIKSMVGKVKDAASSVAGAVADFLGFHSPSKKGPGKEADKWMPNMMQMFADGIQDNIYEVSAAVSMTAGSIKQGMQPNTDDMATSIGSAISQSIQGLNIGGGDITIVVRVGEDTLTDKVVSNINRKNRINGKTVIQV